MFLKKIFIFLAVVFLVVDICLLGFYIQANNNLKMLSDNLMEDTVKYYASAGVKLDKEDIVRYVPDNKIYVFASDNGTIGSGVAQSFTKALLSKNAKVNVVETPDGTSYTVSENGKNVGSLRLYTEGFGFEYVSGSFNADVIRLPDSAVYNGKNDLDRGEKKSIDAFVSALSPSLKNNYEITGSMDIDNLLCVSVVQLVDNGCPVDNMYISIALDGDTVVCAKGNIILSVIEKKYSEPLYDGINALNRVDVSDVKEFISEKIVYTYRYSGRDVYYLIPQWKIEYVDNAGQRKTQYVDAIKS